MKRYIAFLFETLESGGWGDVIMDETDRAQSFDTVEEALEEIDKKLPKLLEASVWEATRQVVDLHSGIIVEHSITCDGHKWRAV